MITARFFVIQHIFNFRQIYGKWKKKKNTNNIRLFVSHAPTHTSFLSNIELLPGKFRRQSCSQLTRPTHHHHHQHRIARGIYMAFYIAVVLIAYFLIKTFSIPIEMNEMLEKGEHNDRAKIRFTRGYATALWMWISECWNPVHLWMPRISSPQFILNNEEENGGEGGEVSMGMHVKLLQSARYSAVNHCQHDAQLHTGYA